MAFEDDKLLAKLGYFSIASFVYNLIYLFISYDSGIRIKTDSSEVIALTSHKSDYINSIYVILNEVMKKRMETLQKKQTIYKQIK
jgi:hypothetical protein